MTATPVTTIKITSSLIWHSFSLNLAQSISLKKENVGKILNFVLLYVFFSLILDTRRFFFFFKAQYLFYNIIYS